MVMGPMFAFVGLAVRLLDVIPALGSSLWIALSTFVMVAVWRDPFPAFLHNLPLFSLAMANAILHGIEAPRDFLTWSPSASSESSRKSIGYLSYSFREGKLQCNIWRTLESQQPLFTIHAMSIPGQAQIVLESIIQNGYSHIKGRNLNTFRDHGDVKQNRSFDE